jgi:phosphopantothenoylcysteine decarboxylase/phosphopantothenate--cysteine ligase
VRYIGNRSSGKMGFALAEEAAMRGAHGATRHRSQRASRPCHRRARTDVVSAAQMAEACKADRHSTSDVVIMSAAVADFRPANPATRQDQEEGQRALESTFGAYRGHSRMDGKPISQAARSLVGFALETNDA